MKLERPDWIDVPLTTQGGISDYIRLLEKRIIELGEEVKQLETEHNKQQETKRLTELWAKGELEN